MGVKKFFGSVWSFLDSKTYTLLVSFINLVVFVLTLDTIYLVISLIMIVLYKLEVLDEKVDILLTEEVVDDEKN